MSRVIAIVACGLSLAACSTSLSVPSMDFLKSAPTTETLRLESDPPGAEAKTSQGQTCRTPCEVKVQTAANMSVTFALNGYQPQTVTVQQEGGVTPTRGDPDTSAQQARLSPNPVYVELQAAPAVTPPKKKKNVASKKPPAATAAAPAEPPGPATAAAIPTPMATEQAPSGNAYPWPSR
jgi:hypothetical protein